MTWLRFYVRMAFKLLIALFLYIGNITSKSDQPK